MPIDSLQLAALGAFTRNMNRLGDVTDPLQAIVDAAQLKGRIEVLQEIEVLDVEDATRAREMVDLILTTLLDRYLDTRYDGAPVRGVVASLQKFVKGL
ncbi:hypothetical protein D3C84_608290 [compost metagenome]